jgi:hypothetical protein
MGVFDRTSVRTSIGFDMGKDVFVVGFDTNRKIFRSQDQRLALVQTFRRLPTAVDMEACLAVSNFAQVLPDADLVGYGTPLAAARCACAYRRLKCRL